MYLVFIRGQKTIPIYYYPLVDYVADARDSSMMMTDRYINICMHIHIRIHTSYTYTYSYTYLYACTYSCTYLYAYTYSYTYLYKYIYLYKYTHIHIHIHAHIHIHINLLIHMYIHMHIHINLKKFTCQVRIYNVTLSIYNIYDAHSLTYPLIHSLTHAT
jgi:hypothetical protein